MKRSAILMGVVLSMTGALFAQGWSESGPKTITNVDLEKYRQQRLAGEREYRKLYAEMGFPSPEELQAQIERDKREKLEFAAQLRQERLESERIDIERGRLALEAVRVQSEIAAREEEAANRNSESSAFNGYPGYGYPPPYPYYGGYGGNRIYIPRNYGRYGRRGNYGQRYSPLWRYNPWGVYPGGPQYRPRYAPPLFGGGSIFFP